MSDATIGKTIKRKRTRKRIRKLIAWIIFIALAAGAVNLFVIRELKAAATLTYDSFTAARGSISNSMSFSGSIAVVNDETLTSDAAATVRKIYVTEGEAVAAEQRLIRLSDGEILRAGFNGEVNEISVEEGDDVAANQSLIEVVDFQNLQVSIRVDEYSMASVSVGQQCNVTVLALNQTFESEITHINRIPSGGGSTAYYTVTAEFSGSTEALPGMQVTVVIVKNEAQNAVILSSDALSFGPSNSAYVLMKNEAGEMEQVAVEIGVDNDNYVEITAGLDAGATVYKAVETAQDGGGLLSIFSSLRKRQTDAATTTTTALPAGNFDPSTMPQRDFEGGSFGGGMP